jgi:pyruvate dehydrogenase E2 component (dihydrolipoamide acetyltransferase)
MGEFRMPSLGADMTEGTLIEWLVKSGDQVHRGDLVAVIDTDKAAIDVEVFEDGVVDRLLVEPGTRIPVGAALALIAGPNGAGAGGQQAPPAPSVSPVPEGLATPVPGATPLVRKVARQLGIDLATVTGTGRNGAITRADVEAAGRLPGHRTQAPGPAERVRATPLARRRAAALGLDLLTVPGSGRDGAITAADVARAATPAARALPRAPAAPPPSPSTATTAANGAADRTASMRRAIATLMARSKREIPHYYLSTQVELSGATAYLAERNAHRPVTERLVPAALMLRATAVAARGVPQLNGFWEGDAFVPGEGIHLGVAISLRHGGMVAPTLRDADALRVADLMAALRDLVARTRGGRLRGSEMTGATITVTNLGDRGAESVFGVIYPPQVALVGFGAIRERPWAQDGMLAVRPVVTVTLSADHRATDGHLGGRFLAEIERLLRHPEEL